MLLKMPALPEMTDCHPTPAAMPSLPPHPPAQHTLGGQPQPEPQEGWGVEGEMQGEASSHTWAGHSEEQAQSPGLSHMGAVGKAKKVPASHPQPWPRGCPQSTTLPCPAPARSPPNNNQRKRKRCHLPMPALRVSKPSGMGGARQLLGAWRGGGLPGGGHGTAYLEPPSLPEHAHRPHTHHHGVS